MATAVTGIRPGLRPTELQRRAESAYALCEAAPDRARAAALQVMSEAGNDPTALVLAMRALGLAIRALEGPKEAGRVLLEACRLGKRHGLSTPLALVRLTYAAALAEMGRISAALSECDQAARVLRGNDAGSLLSQRAFILSRAGRTEEALADYARAVPLLRASGDIAGQCRVYVNRGIVLAYLGRLTASESNLRAGLALAEAHELFDVAGAMQQNLGFVMVRRGDIPAALRLLGEAYGDMHQYNRFSVTYDRAEALLIGGLAAEARRSLEELIGDLSQAGFAVDTAEWNLMLAHAALLEGDAPAARFFAETALGQFRSQRRGSWALLAQQLVIRSRWAAGERTTKLATAARDAHARLSTAGWQVAALHCLLVAGRVELDRGRIEAARRDLAEAARARRRGPADLRAAAWYAEALLRLAGNDRRGAAAALKAGLRVVDEHSASLGATDMRVHASGLGAELAEQGVQLAVESGKPAAVLEWIERFRAGALRRRPVQPPSDSKLAADLAELRRVTAELAQQTAAGKDSRALRSEQLKLEDAVRHRSRHASGQRSTTAALDVQELTTALGSRALIEILRVDEAMFAITAIEGRLRMHDLGSFPDALREQESIRFSLHRLARGHGSEASLAAATTGLEDSADALEKLLIAPVLDLIDDRELVIIPTGQLHALPWPVLPSLRGRPLSVAPSATTWLAASRSAGRRARPSPASPVLVAGPQLAHALPEVEALSKLYAKPQLLTGENATVDAVRRALDGAELAHVAAHGRFRADNPQFSALDLHDGSLTVYDLERVRRGPRRLVLSACDSGLSAVHAGDELMGLASAVFSLGTSTLIASVVPVADNVTKALMLELHNEMCAGRSPSRALAVAQQRVRADGFVCFGAG